MTPPHLLRGFGPLLLFGVVAGCFLALPALAPSEQAASVSPVPDPAPLPPSDPDALALLRKAASVAVSKSYRGAEVVAVAGNAPSTSVVRVEHKALVGTEMTVTSGATTPPEPAFDPDDPALVDSAPASSPAAAITSGEGWATLVAATYVARGGGSDQVAGDPCTVLELTRADGTMAARLCVSTSSGLILDREIFDVHGALMRYSSYKSVSVVPDDAVSDVESPKAEAAEAGSALSPAELTTLRDSGTAAPATLAGTLTLVDARTYTDDRTRTLQLTYSDGLSSLSLTEQPGHLAALPAGWQQVTRAGAQVDQQNGLPERLAWADGGTVYTVVSDTDQTTLDTVLSELPRSGRSLSYGKRMQKGLDRVGSWLDPTS